MSASIRNYSYILHKTIVKITVSGGILGLLVHDYDTHNFMLIQNVKAINILMNFIAV